MHKNKFSIFNYRYLSFSRMLKLKFVMLVTFVYVSVILSPSIVYADWPMVAHDPQRSSYSPEDTSPERVTKIKWIKPFTPPFSRGFIPSKAHIITVSRQANSMVYVPTSDGIYALNPTTGNLIWHYPTSMPVGNSPTIVNDIMYVPVFDKTIHAVNAITGQKIWQTHKAGAGFDTSPLVVNDKIYAGNRDSYFYAFNLDGSLAWYFLTGGPITQSAAYHQPSQTIFFGSADAHAYALSANDANQDGIGDLIWKSPKYPGEGFRTFWPVIFGETVVFSRTINYAPMDLIEHENPLGQYSQKSVLFKDTIPTNDQGEIDGTSFNDWLNQNPDARTVYVFNRSTGQPIAQQPPMLFWGNSSDNRYPPVHYMDKLYFLTPWRYSWFGSGRYVSWQAGYYFKTVSGLESNFESADEPEALSIFGGALWHNDGGDGVDKGGSVHLTKSHTNSFWMSNHYLCFGITDCSLSNYYPYYGRWMDFRYGNPIYLNNLNWGATLGTHGYQNPPVPLNGMVYFHRSNAVVAMEP